MISCMESIPVVRCLVGVTETPTTMWGHVGVTETPMTMWGPVGVTETPTTRWGPVGVTETLTQIFGFMDNYYRLQTEKI